MNIDYKVNASLVACDN